MSGEPWNVESTSPCSHPMTYETRVGELKRRIIATLCPIDAVIVCEMVFPSSETREFAKRRPFKRSKRGSSGSACGVVRSWHVAELYGVTTARVTEAMNAAREKIGAILENA